MGIPLFGISAAGIRIMSESPGGAFIDQFKNWSIPLSDFPVSHKGKSDASESLYGVFGTHQSREEASALKD